MYPLTSNGSRIPLPSARRLHVSGHIQLFIRIPPGSLPHWGPLLGRRPSYSSIRATNSYSTKTVGGIDSCNQLVETPQHLLPDPTRPETTVWTESTTSHNITRDIHPVEGATCSKQTPMHACGVSFFADDHLTLFASIDIALQVEESANTTCCGLW